MLFSRHLAEKLHEKLSSIRVIGWDIAITSDGPVFIEGNDNAEISGLQTVNGGLKQTIQGLLKNEFNN
jgi:glutathione synthase/RimK-type ligase-like ATP-grasp enzyme